MSEWIWLLLAASATMIATGLGVIPVALSHERAHDWRALFVGVAIGAMTVAAIAGLLLPGFDQGSPAEVWGGFAIGAVLFFAVRSALRRHEVGVGDLRGADMGRAALVFFVLLAHSLPEGFAIGTAFASPDADVSLFVILAIGLQNVPEGTAVAIPLSDAGVPLWRQFWLATATSAPQPIGALIAFALVDSIDSLLPVSFGFAAGAMLVLVAVEMVPDALGSESRRLAAAGVVLGAALIFALELLLGV